MNQIITAANPLRMLWTRNRFEVQGGLPDYVRYFVGTKNARA